MAQLQPLDLVAPGRWGLNTERKNNLLRPEWAHTALNAVINRSGRIAARKGWADQTTTPIAGTPQIQVIHEYLREDGTSSILSAANNLIFKNIDDFTDAANDITSSTAPTANHWKFVNFNDRCLGFQRDHTPIVYTGSGDFTDASYTGTGPDGNEAHAAFGRVWAVDADLQTIRYSKLLDDTDYSTASGGGTIDMRSLWTQGTDEVVAISSVGATLIVFGKNHIFLWEDGSGSEVGITPSALTLADVIEGTGCIARDSVQPTGEGDLIFLSRHGLQSLGRVIKEKSNPVVSLTKNVRREFLDNLKTQRDSDSALDQVRSVHVPEEGIYIIHFPVPAVFYVVDTHHPFADDEDGSPSMPVLQWQVGGSIMGMAAISTGKLYFGSSGVVGWYSGNLDDAATYDFNFSTGWMDFGPELNHRLKMLKQLVGTVEVATATLTWYWEFDFSGTTLTRSFSYTSATTGEFNIAEFNEDEFSGGVQLTRKALPGHGEGQFIRVGVSATINDFDVVVQQISLAPGIGRMVT